MSETRSHDIIDSKLSTLSRIYCGMRKRNGNDVTEREMGAFIREVVASKFPDGFTVLQVAEGGWADMATGMTIREPSRVIEVAHGSQDGERVLDLARSYKRRFQQDAVMVASVPIQTQFV